MDKVKLFKKLTDEFVEGAFAEGSFTERQILNYYDALEEAGITATEHFQAPLCGLIHQGLLLYTAYEMARKLATIQDDEDMATRAQNECVKFVSYYISKYKHTQLKDRNGNNE